MDGSPVAVLPMPGLSPGTCAAQATSRKTWSAHFHTILGYGPVGHGIGMRPKITRSKRRWKRVWPCWKASWGNSPMRRRCLRVGASWGFSQGDDQPGLLTDATGPVGWRPELPAFWRRRLSSIRRRQRLSPSHLLGARAQRSEHTVCSAVKGRTPGQGQGHDRCRLRHRPLDRLQPKSRPRSTGWPTCLPADPDSPVSGVQGEQPILHGADERADVERLGQRRRHHGAGVERCVRRRGRPPTGHRHRAADRRSC